MEGITVLIITLLGVVGLCFGIYLLTSPKEEQGFGLKAVAIMWLLLGVNLIYTAGSQTSTTTGGGYGTHRSVLPLGGTVLPRTGQQ